ncbi:hypothetical protein C5B42_03740 [Candidatus Cerribacteria bacterium 'Amazon FNV 2010 28 9']|uniref:Uncharacterized protein n=1 Tax=Candidatus Cerribacteria bacterium 'Amazon FNV 2010 28 9' TaxID=2081795 RepID=A0A317JSJ1_9BACT|nr:MAG: hypothetical protein C5B42_03740 [Candidatus Cerribacteria bacterium 'Amazon FNV 2010 28 9']
MSETKLLVGSLSNDLFRVANLTQRGSSLAAMRFMIEAQKWAQQLQKENIASYIRDIAREITLCKTTEISLEMAERYLMYGILLQNYSLHS